MLPTREPATRELATGGAALIAPVEEQPASAPAAEEVLPQRVKPRVAPVSKTKPTRRLQPGDLVCGQCGEGNPPVRKFCSRCGESLVAAEVVRTPWYRRLMFWRRGPRTLEAGSRPGREGVKGPKGAALGKQYRRLRAALAALLLFLSLLYLAAPPVKDLVDRTIGRPIIALKDTVVGWFNGLSDPFIDVAPVAAVSEPNALEVKDHPASNVIDSTDSFWAGRFEPGEDRPGVRLTFSAADASNTYETVFITGGGTGEDQDAFLHPKKIRFTYGSSNSETCTLPEASGEPQRCDLTEAVTFTKVTITVLSVFKKQGLDQVAISDIQFKMQE